MYSSSSPLIIPKSVISSGQVEKRDDKRYGPKLPGKRLFGKKNQ